MTFDLTASNQWCMYIFWLDSVASGGQNSLSCGKKKKAVVVEADQCGQNPVNGCSTQMMAGP